MTKKIAILPGDGIGPEIMTEVIKVIDVLVNNFGLDVESEEAPFGGAGYDAAGSPLPEATLALCREADAVLGGAIGGPQYDKLEWSLRPERGLLGLRSALGLFVNLRPATLYAELSGASTLKPEIVSGLDIMIVQPNLPRGERWSDDTQLFNLDRVGLYTERIVRASGLDPAWVVWPENLVTTPVDASLRPAW